MRVLIAYDASPGADEALADLALAGLPDGTDVLVLAAAPDAVAPAAEPSSGAASAGVFGTPSRRDSARLALDHAMAVAAHGEERLRGRFPSWRFEHAAARGDAADVMTDAAGRWKADLVVVGSHASPTAPWVRALGSVARRVVARAPCSVRIGRRNVDAPPAARVERPRPACVLVGFDGSAGAIAAIDAVAARAWPRGSTVHVLVAVDPVVVAAGAPPDEGGVPWLGLRELVSAATAKLTASGLMASADIVTAEPRHAIVEEASRREADVVFVGARGATEAAPHPLVGSTASVVAASAPCAVEVIRAAGDVQT